MPESKAKAKAASRARRPTKSTGSSAKAGAKSKSDAAASRATGKAASRLIDQRIRDLGDWRGETLAHMRALILEADPEMIEEWKWMGTPVWSHHGNVCTGETYKNVVKLTFAHGASISDPAGLFNSSLEGNTRRAIDIHEGDSIDTRAFKALVKAAVARNVPATNTAKSRKRPGKAIKSPTGKKAAVVLLAGGNPQIAKADGDTPVQAYIAAMPGWKSDIGRRLDALIVRTVPNVRKAVRWNTPFYGSEGRGWFLGFHCLTKYVKVAFFRGASLRPLPPGESKQNDVRYLDIHEDDPFDEKLVAGWIRRAAELPGEELF